MPFTIIRNDITKIRADAIVNAANTQLLMGGGVCGAIFDAAGADELQAACDELAPIKTGEAVITKGFNLPAKYIIHVAGPIYGGGQYGEEALLKSCYVNALDLAKRYDCESVAFPLISSGIYGYPKDEALTVATGAIGEWLMKNDMDVILVMFDKSAFMLSQKLLGDVKAFIDENYVDEKEDKYQRRRRTRVEEKKPDFRDFALGAVLFEESVAYKQIPAPLKPAGIDDLMKRLDEPFSVFLLRLIDAKGKTDVEIYKKANIDRKLFSKIRNPDYRPSKKTVVALSVALELTLGETGALLESAGFALSRNQKFDVIVEYFITRAVYDVYTINNVLFEYDQPLLGG